jgi:hypothetical protein
VEEFEKMRTSKDGGIRNVEDFERSRTSKDRGIRKIEEFEKLRNSKGRGIRKMEEFDNMRIRIYMEFDNMGSPWCTAHNDNKIKFRGNFFFKKISRNFPRGLPVVHSHK